MSLAAAVSEAGCGRSDACAREARQVESRLLSEGENPRKIFRDRLNAVLGRDMDTEQRDDEEALREQQAREHSRMGQLLCRNHLMTGSFVPTGHEWLLDNLDDLEKEPFSAEPLSSAWYLMQLKLHALKLRPRGPLTARTAHDILSSHDNFYFHSPYSQENFLHRLRCRFASDASAPAQQAVGRTSHFELGASSLASLSCSPRSAESAHADAPTAGASPQREHWAGSPGGGPAHAAGTGFPVRAIGGHLAPSPPRQEVHRSLPASPSVAPRTSLVPGPAAGALANLAASLLAKHELKTGSPWVLPSLSTPQSLVREQVCQLRADLPAPAKACHSADRIGKTPEDTGAAPMTQNRGLASFHAPLAEKLILARRLLYLSQGGGVGVSEAGATAANPPPSPAVVERDKVVEQSDQAQSPATLQRVQARVLESSKGRRSRQVQASVQPLDVLSQSQLGGNRRETASVCKQAPGQQEAGLDSPWRANVKVARDALQPRRSRDRSPGESEASSCASEGMQQRVPQPTSPKAAAGIRGDGARDPDSQRVEGQRARACVQRLQAEDANEADLAGGLGGSEPVGTGRRESGGETREVWSATEADQLRTELMEKQRELIAQSQMLEREKDFFSVEQDKWPETRKESFYAQLVEKQRELLQSIEKQKERLLQSQVTAQQKRESRSAQATEQRKDAGPAGSETVAQARGNEPCGRVSAPEKKATDVQPLPCSAPRAKHPDASLHAPTGQQVAGNCVPQARIPARADEAHPESPRAKQQTEAGLLSPSTRSTTDEKRRSTDLAENGSALTRGDRGFEGTSQEDSAGEQRPGDGVRETWRSGADTETKHEKQRGAQQGVEDRPKTGACGGERHDTRQEKLRNATDGGSATLAGTAVDVRTAGACSRAHASASFVGVPLLSSSTVVSPSALLRPATPRSSVASGASQHAPLETASPSSSARALGCVTASSGPRIEAANGRTRGEQGSGTAPVVPVVCGVNPAACRAAPLLNLASLAPLHHLLYPALHRQLVAACEVSAAQRSCVPRDAELGDLLQNYLLPMPLAGAAGAPGGGAFFPASLSSPLSSVSPRPVSAPLPHLATGVWVQQGESGTAPLLSPLATERTAAAPGECVKGDRKAGSEKQPKDKGPRGLGGTGESRQAPSIPPLERLVDIAMAYSSCLPPCAPLRGGHDDGHSVSPGARSKKAAPKAGPDASQRPNRLHHHQPLRCVWFLDASSASASPLAAGNAIAKQRPSPSRRTSVASCTDAAELREKEKGGGLREGQWCCSRSHPKGRSTGTTFSVKLFGYEEAKRLALYTALYAYSPQDRQEVLQELIDEAVAASSSSPSASPLPNPERFSGILEMQRKPASLASPPDASLAPAICVRLEACTFPLPVLSGSSFRSSHASSGGSGAKAPPANVSRARPSLLLSHPGAVSRNGKASQSRQPRASPRLPALSPSSRSSVLAASKKGETSGEADQETKLRAVETGEKTGRRENRRRTPDIFAGNNENVARKREKSRSPRSLRRRHFSSGQLRMQEGSGRATTRRLGVEREETKTARQSTDSFETNGSNGAGQNGSVELASVSGLNVRHCRSVAVKAIAGKRGQNSESVSCRLRSSSSSSVSVSSSSSASTSSSQCGASSVRLSSLSGPERGEERPTGACPRASRSRAIWLSSRAATLRSSPPAAGGGEVVGQAREERRTRKGA